MCSGINALFTSDGDEEEVGGEDHRSLALFCYSSAILRGRREMEAEKDG